MSEKCDRCGENLPTAMQGRKATGNSAGQKFMIDGEIKKFCTDCVEEVEN